MSLQWLEKPTTDNGVQKRPEDRIRVEHAWRENLLLWKTTIAEIKNRGLKTKTLAEMNQALLKSTVESVDSIKAARKVEEGNQTLTNIQSWDMILPPGLDKNPLKRKGVKKDSLAKKLSSSFLSCGTESSALLALDKISGTGLDARQREITNQALRNSLFGGKNTSKSDREANIEDKSLGYAIEALKLAMLPDSIFGLVLARGQFRERKNCQYSTYIFHIFLFFLL